MPLEGLHGVGRTRRVVPARGRPAAAGELVETDRPDREPGPPANPDRRGAIMNMSGHDWPRDWPRDGAPVSAGVSLADSRAAITMACRSLHGSAAAAGAAPMRYAPGRHTR